MAYEFDKRDAGSDDRIPKIPELWHAQDRIYKILPLDPTFVSCNSVIEDADDAKRHIGIDTNDHLPSPENVSFGLDPSIGILRLLLDTPKVNGYIIDLRYTRRLNRRSLNFSELTSDNEVNEQLKTVPALGAILVNPETGRLWFDCEHEEELRPYAVWLAEYVDAEREGRARIVMESPPSTTPEFSESVAPHEQS